MSKQFWKGIVITVATLLFTGCGQSGADEEQYILDAIEASGVTEEMSDYDKCIAFNNYMCAVLSYAEAFDENGNPVDNVWTINSERCLIDGQANCTGYSAAFRAMCYTAGIECHICYGDPAVFDHAWNYVVIDGTGYYVDVCKNDDAEFPNRYLMCTDLSESHPIARME